MSESLGKDNLPGEYQCFLQNQPTTWWHPCCKLAGSRRHHRQGAQRNYRAQGDIPSDHANSGDNGWDPKCARHDGMINTYKPPLFASIVIEGSHRPVIVGKVLTVDIESPHCRIVESLTRVNTEGPNSSFEGTRYRYGP